MILVIPRCPGDSSNFTEHRDKLHGTLSTFDAVDKKVRGELVEIPI